MLDLVSFAVQFYVVAGLTFFQLATSRLSPHVDQFFLVCVVEQGRDIAR